MDDVTQTLSESLNSAKHWASSNNDLITNIILHSVIGIILLCAGLCIARWVSVWFAKILKLRHVDDTITSFLSLFVRYLITGITIIITISQLGVQTTSIAAAIGAGGLAIGLALQGSLSNFAAGVLLILFRPFKVHEYIGTGDVLGTVRAIQLFSTRLEGVDGTLIIIPNSVLLGSNIVNYTRDPFRRIEINVYVNYQADIDTVKKLFTNTVKKENNILQNKEIDVFLSDIKVIGYCWVMEFTVRAWTVNALLTPTQNALMEALKKAIDNNQLSAVEQGKGINVL